MLNQHLNECKTVLVCMNLQNCALNLLKVAQSQKSVSFPEIVLKKMI